MWILVKTAGFVTRQFRIQEARLVLATNAITNANIVGSGGWVTLPPGSADLSVDGRAIVSAQRGGKMVLFVRKRYHPDELAGYLYMSHRAESMCLGRPNIELAGNPAIAPLVIKKAFGDGYYVEPMLTD